MINSSGYLQFKLIVPGSDSILTGFNRIEDFNKKNNLTGKSDSNFRKGSNQMPVQQSN